LLFKFRFLKFKLLADIVRSKSLTARVLNYIQLILRRYCYSINPSTQLSKYAISH